MTTFANFKPLLQQLSKHSFHEEAPSLSSLFIPDRSNDKVRTYYSLFDHVNRNAKLILVGVTPGRTQMNNSLKAAVDALKENLDDDQVIARAKQAASFSGTMQKKLIAMLDHHGFNKRLGIRSCEELWQDANHLVHFTSALRNPVFVMEKGKEANYTGGAPKLKSYKAFKPMLAELRAELMSIPNALILPLGAQVAEVLQDLVEDGDLPIQRLLNHEGSVVEFPHPSPSNGESHALALMQALPPVDEYIQSRLAKYRAEKRAENKSLTRAEELAYLKKRTSYWSRASKTRSAIESLA